MNEEIEYAEMLEIPVSTVNVVKKPRKRKKSVAPQPVEEPSTPKTALKESVIAQVNERLDEPTQSEIPPVETENNGGRLDFDPIPDRIDTVRLYSTDEKRRFADENALFPDDYTLQSDENEGGRYALNAHYTPKAVRRVLGVEFALSCALCGAIFLTNVFMPSSAVNTFFRSLSESPKQAQADDTPYSEFQLSPVVSENSDAELSLSPTGVLTLTDACHIYPSANGKITDVSQDSDGLYVMKIGYSDTFTGVISGLSTTYYAVGDEVKANVPVGYSDGESEVQFTMYSSGELLNCFQLTDENCLAWVSAQS